MKSRASNEKKKTNFINAEVFKDGKYERICRNGDE